MAFRFKDFQYIYFESLLEALTDDETITVSKDVSILLVMIMGIQRLTYSYKSWGIFNHPYLV